MAAGLGSRYGGLKQTAPVDEEGHFLIDFAVYDAIRAGIEEVVIILKPELEADFRETIGRRIAPFIKVTYAFQRLEDCLPSGFSVPSERKKPWGTAHAIMCAADKISGSFVVINADDYYGRSAYESVFRFLTNVNTENEHAVVGFRIENTLTENGSVARGVCRVSDGYLTDITERTRIEKRGGCAAYTEDGEHWHDIPQGTIVSMNMWGFQNGILNDITDAFPIFIKERLPLSPEKAEFFLPYVPDMLVSQGKARVRVLPSEEAWYGVTYQPDMPKVASAVADMKGKGIYPAKLWG
jgi:dTDP-glucose pyrophosphorylase